MARPSGAWCALTRPPARSSSGSRWVATSILTHLWPRAAPSGSETTADRGCSGSTRRAWMASDTVDRGRRWTARGPGSRGVPGLVMSGVPSPAVSKCITGRWRAWTRQESQAAIVARRAGVSPR